MRYGLIMISLILLLCCAACQGPQATQQPTPPRAEEATPGTPDIGPEPMGSGSQQQVHEALFTVFDEHNLREYYAGLGKELLYCQIHTTGDFAVVAFEYAPNDILQLECIDRQGGRQHFTNAAWPPADIQFYSADYFTLTGYFAVNGTSPPPTTFPQKIGFYRSGADIQRNEGLHYLAPLAQSYTIGNGAKAVLSGLHLTATGLDLEFGPQHGYEGEFYAAYASIPVSEFRYDEENGIGIITMQETLLGINEGKIFYDDPQGAIHSLRVYSADENSIIELRLNEQAQFYRWTRAEKLNFDPIAALRFYLSEDSLI